MELIQTLVPPEYKLVTDVYVNSTNRKYTNSRTNKVSYFGDQIKILFKITKEILDLNAKKRFLLKQEVLFLEYSLKLFNKKSKEINLNDFERLVSYSITAAVGRLYMIKIKLGNEIKERNFKVSQLDKEYFFAIENLLLQFSIMVDEFERYGPLNVKNNKIYMDPGRKNKFLELANKAQLIFKNLNELIISIVLSDFESVRRISKWIIQQDKIKFDLNNKILA